MVASGSSKFGSLVTSGVTRRQSQVYFVDSKGIFTPTPYFVPGYKKVPLFYKIADMWRS